MSKHTTGTLFYDRESGLLYDGSFLNRHIAKTIEGGTPEAEREANGVLFASAPRMRATLELVLQYFTNSNAVDESHVVAELFRSLQDSGMDRGELNDAAMSLICGAASVPLDTSEIEEDFPRPQGVLDALAEPANIAARMDAQPEATERLLSDVLGANEYPAIDHDDDEPDSFQSHANPEPVL